MFVSLDLETTGFDSVKDKIIEFGAIKFDLDGNTETLQFLCHPGITLPDIIPHITGITDEALEGKPAFSEKLQEVKDFIGDLPIIGHNIQFDVGFLNENGIETPDNALYDTCQMAGILLPGLPSYSLEILSHYLSLTHEDKHRALDDSIAAKELFEKLANYFQGLRPELIEEIHSLCEKTSWQFKDFFLSLKHDPSKTTKIEKENPEIELKETEIDENLLKDENGLFEIVPPYENLIKTLSQKASNETHIAISHQKFYKLKESLRKANTILDSPKNYVSEKRFNKFKEKEFFDDNEFIGLLKVLIWLEETETKLLNEIILFREEKVIIQQINATETPERTKEKNNSPIICTHQYLIDEKPEIKDLIVIDFNKFAESLHFTESKFLSLNILLEQIKLIRENSGENQVTESLKSKTEMLFGLIEIFFEKHNDNDSYGKRAFIDDSYGSLQEAQNIKELIANLIEISKDLIEIKTDENLKYLKLWKTSLETLDQTLRTPNTANGLIWAEEDYFTQALVLRTSPISLKEPIENILSKTSSYKLIDQNLDLNDNCAHTKILYKIDELLPLHKNYLPREDLDIYITEDVPAYEPNEETTIKFLKTYLAEKKGKTVVIFNSRKKLQQFTLELSTPLKEAGVTVISQLTGSLGKIQEQYKKDPENSVLFITPNLWQNFPDHDKIENLVVHKIPFDPPSDPFIITTGKNFEDPFNDFQIPRAIFSIKKLVNHLSPSDGKKEAIILDQRLIKKDYGKHFVDNLAAVATIKIVNTASLID